MRWNKYQSVRFINAALNIFLLARDPVVAVDGWLSSFDTKFEDPGIRLPANCVAKNCQE